MANTSKDVYESLDNSYNPLHLNVHFATKHWQK